MVKCEKCGRDCDCGDNCECKGKDCSCRDDDPGVYWRDEELKPKKEEI